MPLTQDRYLTLLTACDHYEAELDAHKELINTLDRQISDGKTTRAEAYAVLSNTIAETTIPKEVERTISAERAHFMATSRRNDAAKEYKRRMRAGESTLGIVEAAKSLPVYRRGEARPNATALANSLTQELDPAIRKEYRQILGGDEKPRAIGCCASFCYNLEVGVCLQRNNFEYICKNDPTHTRYLVEDREPEAIDTGDVL